MVATPAVGEKIPLFMEGKAKTPGYFRLCDGNPPSPVLWGYTLSTRIFSIQLVEKNAQEKPL
jgi:hypothetical protein